MFQWVPIFQDGQLLTGEMSLPVSVEKLPPHYSLYRPEVSTALFPETECLMCEACWVEKKIKVTVSVNPVTICQYRLFVRVRNLLFSLFICSVLLKMLNQACDSKVVATSVIMGEIFPPHGRILLFENCQIQNSLFSNPLPPPLPLPPPQKESFLF